MHLFDDVLRQFFLQFVAYTHVLSNAYVYPRILYWNDTPNSSRYVLLLLRIKVPQRSVVGKY